MKREQNKLKINHEHYCIKWLCEHGYLLHEIDKLQNACLHSCSKIGCLHEVQYIIEKGTYEEDCRSKIWVLILFILKGANIAVQDRYLSSVCYGNLSVV